MSALATVKENNFRPLNQIQHGYFMKKNICFIASVIFLFSLMQFLLEKDQTITLLVPEVNGEQILNFSMEMPYSPENGSPRVRYEFPTLAEGDVAPVAIPSIQWVYRDDEMFIQINTTVGYKAVKTVAETNSHLSDTIVDIQVI
jgi:hypothetical protein